MMKRLPPTLAAALAVALATAATPSASAQVPERESRTFVVPPPSSESTGGVPVEPVAPLHGAPRLRGFQLETRDAMHPDEITLVGLDQSERPYRQDLPLDRSPLGGTARPADEQDEELYRRELAIYSGENVEVPPDEEPPAAREEPPAATPPAAVRRGPGPWAFGSLLSAGAVACVAFVAWKRRRDRTGQRQRDAR